MPAPSDLIHQTATSTGTGNFTLVAVNGKRSFNDGFGTGGTDLFDYYISSRDAAEWERGTGHLSDATTLVRDTVIASSNANAAVNFAAGTKDVTNDVPAAKQVTTDTTQTLTGKTIDLTSNTLVGSVAEFNAALESADFYTSGGTDVAVADGGTGASTVAAARVNLGLLPGIPGGRLTLTSNTPVLTANATAQTTIYYTPYLHRYAPIYDGTNFVMTDLGAELSQATTDSTKSPAAATTNSNYDLFLWSDSGTLRCTRGPAWTSGTARGTGAGTTELERVQGIYVNKIAITNGPAAQRGTYVGTIRTNGSSQVDMRFVAVNAASEVSNIGVWNAYNRAKVFARILTTTTSWTYATATWRQWNASGNYQYQFVSGLELDALTVFSAPNARFLNGGQMLNGFGLDSTSSPNSIGASSYNAATTNLDCAPVLTHGITPQLGYHYISLMERAANSVSYTLYGANYTQANLDWMA